MMDCLCLKNLQLDKRGESWGWELGTTKEGSRVFDEIDMYGIMYLRTIEDGYRRGERGWELAKTPRRQDELNRFSI